MEENNSVLTDIYIKLKADRTVLTKAEYAKKLGISRATLRRVVNDTSEIRHDLIEKAKSVRAEAKDVSRETFELTKSNSNAGDRHDITPLYTMEELKRKIEEQWQVIKSQQETIHMIARNAPPGYGDKAKND